MQQLCVRRNQGPVVLFPGNGQVEFDRLGRRCVSDAVKCGVLQQRRRFSDGRESENVHYIANCQESVLLREYT